MTRYEYQVLEADSPTVPSEMLNMQGEEGWLLQGVITRDARPPSEPEGEKRWVFYFARELPEGKTVVNQDTAEAAAEAEASPLRGAGAISE